MASNWPNWVKTAVGTKKMERMRYDLLRRLVLREVRLR